MQKAVKYTLFLTALTPLIFTSNLPLPFILGKTIFFRSLIEITLALFLIYLVSDPDALKTTLFKVKNLGKNPLLIAILLFFVSAVVSTIFAVNSYRAFWGDLERGEGLFGLLHYLIFLLLALLVFKKSDWLTFLKISLGVGAVVVFYGLFQFLGIEKNVLALKPRLGVRPESFIGSRAFLGSYSILLITIASVVFFQSISKLWRYLSILIILSSAIIIFLSNTRGPLLGLAVGVFALLIYLSFKPVKPEKLIRLISLISLISLIAISVTFVLTHNAQTWQAIPGLNRLAQSLSKQDNSFQTRLIATNSSWQAYKEKPLLGWGPENFIIAYNKHYNPDYALYEEAWFDRAHNKILDVLVMQGIFGLITYLGIFISIFWLLYKNFNLKPQSYGKNVSPAPFIMAGLLAYFVQNLVLFDQINSYIPLFTLFGFVISDISHIQPSHPQGELPSDGAKPRLLPIIIVAPIILGITYILYSSNYIPYAQAKNIYHVKTSDIDMQSVIKLLKKSFYPNNFAQYSLRPFIIDHFYRKQPEIFLVEDAKPLANILVTSLDEIIEKEPYYARMAIRKVQILLEQAKTEPELYKEAERVARKAFVLSPRQDFYYSLSLALGNQGRFDEAIEISRQAIPLSPNVARSHLNLGMILAAAGEEYHEEAIEELEKVKELNPELKFLTASDFSNWMLVYEALGHIDKIAELAVRRLKIGGDIDAIKRKYYDMALAYYAFKRHKTNLINIAKYLSRFPDAEDGMEVLIDLTEKEKWEIIDNL